MHLSQTLLGLFTVFVSGARGYTEISQWTSLDCGISGYRTSYRWIDGYNVYLNRDTYAYSVYIESYNEQPPSFFYTGLDGSGYIGREVVGGYCFAWNTEQAESIASPSGLGYPNQHTKRNREMKPGQDVVEDEKHRGLGLSRNSTDAGQAT